MFTVQNKEDLSFNTIQETSMYYMQDHIDAIRSLSIKNFNYIIFEEDLDNMYKTEFEKFFKEYMIELINDLSFYVAIDIDNIQNESYRVKLIFSKNIVRFVMNTLPYIFVKEFLEKIGVEGLHDAYDALSADIQQKLISQINVSQAEYNSFSSLMTNISSSITNDKKKVSFDEKLDLLETTMSSKEKLLNYYKDIIQNSGNDGLQKIIKKYLLNDLDNII